MLKSKINAFWEGFKEAVIVDPIGALCSLICIPLIVIWVYAVLYK